MGQLVRSCGPNHPAVWYQTARPIEYRITGTVFVLFQNLDFLGEVNYDFHRFYRWDLTRHRTPDSRAMYLMSRSFACIAWVIVATATLGMFIEDNINRLDPAFMGIMLVNLLAGFLGRLLRLMLLQILPTKPSAFHYHYIPWLTLL